MGGGAGRVRRRRILARDGDAALLERWRTDWLPSEQSYAAAQRPWLRVEVIVDGSAGIIAG